MLLKYLLHLLKKEEERIKASVKRHIDQSRGLAEEKERETKKDIVEERKR